MSFDATCPVVHTAELVGGKWTPLLVRDLAAGRSRFCELERSLAGISPRTLSLRLRALEEDGIVERHTYPEVPPRVEYSLTQKGFDLLPIIECMREYGRRWLCEEVSQGPVERDAGGADETRPMQSARLHSSLHTFALDGAATLAAAVAAGEEVPFEVVEDGSH